MTTDKPKRLTIERAATLTQKLAEVEKLKDYLIKDSCDDDTRIRDLCRPFIDVEGDSHSVPGIVELVERLTEKLRLVLALPGQLLDVHAIADQRDKAVQRADELAGKLAELEGERGELALKNEWLKAELAEVSAVSIERRDKLAALSSTPTERPENNTCPRCGVTNFIPKSSTALCPNCERTYYAEQ